jgi:hypothetical protein
VTSAPASFATPSWSSALSPGAEPAHRHSHAVGVVRPRASRRRVRQVRVHQTGARIARLAAGGVRLVVDDLRSDVAKTRNDGSRGRLGIDYGDARDPKAAVAWLWKFIDGAKIAGELYGRALVVSAAERYAAPGRAREPAVPASRLSSHTDVAAKALRKLAGPHLPASLTRLERAVTRAHARREG